MATPANERHPCSAHQGERAFEFGVDALGVATGGVLHPEPAQRALNTLEWIGRAENLVPAGPSVTGKSHFAVALAHAAIDGRGLTGCALHGTAPDAAVSP